MGAILAWPTHCSYFFPYCWWWLVFAVWLCKSYMLMCFVLPLNTKYIRVWGHASRNIRSFKITCSHEWNCLPHWHIWLARKDTLAKGRETWHLPKWTHSEIENCRYFYSGTVPLFTVITGDSRFMVVFSRVAWTNGHIKYVHVCLLPQILRVK